MNSSKNPQRFPRPLIVLGLAVGGLSTVLAGTAVLLHHLAQQRFEEAIQLWGLEARLADLQERQREFRWEMGRFQRDPSIVSLSVEMDRRACESGRWLAGPERETAVRELPALAEDLRALDAAHDALHDAARRVDARLRASDRAAAMSDLTQYADSAVQRLAAATMVARTLVRAERARRQVTLEQQESTSRAIVLSIAALALLGSAGAAVFVAAHRRAGVALERAVTALENLIAAVPFGVVAVDEAGAISLANRAAEKVLTVGPDGLVGRPFGSIYRGAPPRPGAGDATESEGTLVDVEGNDVPVLWAGLCAEIAEKRLDVYVFFDLRQRRALEEQLQKAQKLEAVGQLASGIAHEINTPAQFVGDSLSFLADTYHDVLVLIATYRAVIARASEADREEAKAAEIDADLEYLSAEAPEALKRAQEGMARITSMVRAMKEFAHPGAQVKQPADLNKALETTLVIARNEYKYVAEVETELSPELPAVMCFPSDLNQVFLNLLVNAAHAIADRFGQDGPKGRIVIRTVREGKVARIEIEDNGCGIPEGIRDRIFQPFFTTKALGRGTGQGLGIVRSIVIDKHGGSLTFTSEVGVGTTFVVRLPVDGTRLDETLETRLMARASKGRGGP